MSGVRLPARIALCAVPLLLGLLLAVLVILVGGNGTIEVRTSPAATLVVAGVLGGILTFLLLVVRPHARRRRLDAGERIRRDAAEAERAAHRRFLGRLDHELKNPVTAIRAALANSEDASPASLRIASAQAARLSELVARLRALSELETRELERSRVDLVALIDEEVAAIRDELEAQRVRRWIDTSFPTVPWPLPPVVGDPDLLAVAVRNVLLNAAKYSDHDARIEVRGAEEGGVVTIEVADTGWGIVAEDVPFVWDELWRGADARAVPGSGLGLSLVRTVVERHGGDVAVRSQRGRGTVIRLRLPLDLGHLETSAQVSLPVFRRTPQALDHK